MLRAVLFDLDDTLYPERDYVISGFRAVGDWAEHRLGFSQALTRAELQSFFDHGFRLDAFQWWLAEKNLPEGLLREMIEVMRAHEPRISLREEARALLEQMQGLFRLGLITQGRQSVQQAKIRSLGLNQWMEAIVILGENEKESWKPSTFPYAQALSIISVPAQEAVYIGDNPAVDFRGARQLGIHTIRIRYPGGAHSLEEPAAPEDAPDDEITNLQSAPAILKQWFALTSHLFSG
jgi:putative hydrolase of the HAD superfamily